ncbi:MAG: type II toxin-antitoxin system RelE family toxin [Thermoplasmatota archaeon]
MTFQVRWDPAAVKALAGLPTTLQVRILKRIEASRADPLRVARRLKGTKAWRIRVGDYRIVVDIDLRTRQIDVLMIGHRKNIYE